MVNTTLVLHRYFFYSAGINQTDDSSMRYFENPYNDGVNPLIDEKIEKFVETVIRPMLFDQEVAAKSQNRRDSLYKGDLGRAFILLFSPWFKGKLF